MPCNWAERPPCKTGTPRQPPLPCQRPHSGLGKRLNGLPGDEGSGISPNFRNLLMEMAVVIVADKVIAAARQQELGE